MTRAELLRRMSSSEFAYWAALYDIEHYERERAQRRAQNRAKARGMSRQVS